jgi:hypothetical protein
MFVNQWGSILGDLEKSRISHLQPLTKKRLAAPKDLIICTTKRLN